MLGIMQVPFSGGGGTYSAKVTVPVKLVPSDANVPAHVHKQARPNPAWNIFTGSKLIENVPALFT